MKKIFYTLILLLYCSSNVFAQISTEGKDFWMGFMENFSTPQSLRLFITSKKNTTAQVVMPLTGYNSGTLTINANQTREVLIPVVSAHTVGQGLRTSGVHITSNDTISVFAINNLQNTTDATVVLPTKALGIKPKYIVSSFQGNTNSEFLIVATEDNTPVKITYLNGTTENITLSSVGNTYQIQSATDLSGTIIEGTDPCKTFAVFAGAICINVPDASCTRCDHIYDQMFPVGTWDKEYIITPFGAGRDAANKSLEQFGGYMLKLFRNDNTTTATINGSTVNWNGSNIAQIAVNDYTPRCVSASSPISVVQYMKGQECNGLPKYITDENGNTNALAKGDPSMLVLNPNSQTVSSAIFNTVSTPNLSDHFVNVIIKTADKGTLKLDGVTVANNKFLNLTSCNTYTYAILQISNGSHKLECPNGLIAYCYGVGERESYAYSAGASFDNIKYRFTVQDDYGISTDGDATSCTTTLINFSGIGENVLAWKWDFGDGSPIQTGQNTTHIYNTIGTYQVKMSVTLADGCATRDIEIFRQINIILFPAPNLGANKTFCGGSSVTLDAGEFGSNNTYLWSNGETTKTIAVSIAGNYSVKVTNSVGCNATSATIQVSQIAAPVLTFPTLANGYCINSPAFDLISVVNPTNNPSATTFTINGIAATSFNPTVLGAGTYTVIFNYQDPITLCSNQASKQVIVYALPTLSFVNLPDFYCINDATVDLFTKVSPSNTSTGSFKVNGVNTNTFNPTTASIGANYLIEYTYTDPNTSCANTISKTITIKDLPTVSFTTLADSYCLDVAAINLFDKVSPSNTSTGSFKANLTVLTTAQAQNFSFTNFPANQNITIEYIYADPTTLCQNKIQRNVLVKALPTLNFVDLKDVYCQQDAAFNLFDKVNPSDNVQGSFTIDGISATSFNPNTAQAGKNYLIKYTYTDPTTTCSNQIEKSISIPNLPVFVDLDNAYCQDFGLVALLANPSNGTFTINGSIVTALNTALYNAGNIIVRYTDAGNCAVISKEVEIIVPPAPIFKVNIEDICSQFGAEEPITIDAGEGVSYRWLHTEETSRLVKITSSGTYTVEVLNELNCTEKRNIIVNERFDCNPRIFMPTAFSPNEDGLNDELEIFGKYFTDFKITIYNRWGEVVFQSKDRNQLWNGTLGGQNAIEGVYTAIVEYRFLNTTKVEKRQSKIILVR